MANPVPRDPSITPEVRRFLDGLARDGSTALADLATALAAEIILGASHASYSAGRVLTDTTSIDVDLGTASQAQFKRAALSGDVTATANSNMVRVDKASEAFSLTGIITPSQITADQNDYNPTGLAAANVLRLTSDAARSITGIAAQGIGRMIVLLNVNSAANAITLIHESGLSTAENRFNLLSATNAPISQFGQRIIWYDTASSRWLVIG